MKTIKTFDPSDVLKYYRDQYPPKLDELQAMEVKYTDDYFPPEKNWQRLSDMEMSFRLAERPITKNDIKNTSKAHYASIIAEHPEFIEDKFKIKEFSDLGYYEVILFIDGQWQIVMIDDFVPSKPQSEEIWFVLLEKAWAKVNRGYENINGVETIPLNVLTGSASDLFTPYQYTIPVENDRIKDPLVFNLEVAEDTDAMITILLQEKRYNRHLEESKYNKGKVFYVLGKYNDKKEVEKIYSDATNTNSLKDTFMTKGMYILWCYIVFPKGEQSINYEQYKSYSIHIQSKSKIEIEFKDFDSSMQVLEHICCSFYRKKHQGKGAAFYGRVEELAKGFCVNVAVNFISIEEIERTQQRRGHYYLIQNDNANNTNFVSGRNDTRRGFVVYNGAEVSVICFEPEENSVCSYKLINEVATNPISYRHEALREIVENFFCASASERRNKFYIVENQLDEEDKEKRRGEESQKRHIRIEAMRKEIEAQKEKEIRKKKIIIDRIRRDEMKEKLNAVNLPQTQIVEYKDEKSKMTSLTQRLDNIKKYVELVNSQLKDYLKSQKIPIYRPEEGAIANIMKREYPQIYPLDPDQPTTNMYIKTCFVYSELDSITKDLTGRGAFYNTNLTEDQYIIYCNFKNKIVSGPTVICDHDYHTMKRYLEGSLIDGEITGYGKFYVETKETNANFCYEGEFEHSKLNGYGQLTFGDGNAFNGVYKDNVKEGIGMLTTANKEYYIGSYSNGVCVRQYKVSKKEGEDALKEEYVQDAIEKIYLQKVLEEYMKIKHEDNEEKKKDDKFIKNVYEKLIEGESDKNAQTISGDNDESYYGQVKDGSIKEGKGALRKGNKVYIGVWKDNQLTGDVSIYTNGELDYKGAVKDYVENGKGVKYLPQKGEFIIGEFKEGKLSKGKLYTHYGLLSKEIIKSSDGSLKRSEMEKKPYAKTFNSRAEALLLSMADEYPEVINKLRCVLPLADHITTRLTWGTKTTPEGNVYIGQTGNKQMNGIGAMIYSQELPYKYAIGYLKNGQVDTFATFYTKDWKVVYQGGMKEGKKYGYGIEHVEGEEYYGYFSNDKREGKGALIVNGSIVKEGKFVNGAIKKVNVINKENKTITKIKYKDGKEKSNKDKTKDAESNEQRLKTQRMKIPVKYEHYIHMFLDLPIEETELFYLSQKCKEKEGKIYIGEMSLNKMKNGRGVLIDSFNGTYYVGYFKYDLQEGQGRLYDLTSNNLLYEGNFHLGKPFGKGHYYYQEDVEIVGTFNELGEGKGSQKFQEGRWYGDFYGLLKNGTGVLINKEDEFKELRKYRLNTIAQ